jgi:hypothetical protein
MRLYLSGWFALLASAGVQVSLVLVAWLAGVSRSGRAALVTVYLLTALTSVAFSYVSLFRWFSEKERPAEVQRALFDRLEANAARAREHLAAAIAEQQRHVLALDEMTAAERQFGRLAQADDTDPYLQRIREAVRQEARTYAASYKEGAGEGVRYTAFARYTKLAQQELDRLRQAEQGLAQWQQAHRPDTPAARQLQDFRAAWDRIPWAEADAARHGPRFEPPALPAYAEFSDRSSGGQEDLLLAFRELVTAPEGRHLFALVLAGFIDLIVFLTAFAAGPHVHGNAGDRWVRSAAAVQGLDDQLFVQGLLRKITPGPRGLAQVDVAALDPGEQQLCLLWAGQGKARLHSVDERSLYVLDRAVHQELLEAMAHPGLALRTLNATAAPPRSTA